MIQDIDKHLELIDRAIVWSEKFRREAFPVNVFKEYRRKLRRIHSAVEGNCSAAAYGESQVGKSYLMSSLLSSSDAPFVIQNSGKSYSFIDEINPSGGNTNKIESTGVITRFTISKGDSPTKDYVRAKLLSVVDIILLIADSYYNDIKLDTDKILKYTDINSSLDGISGLWRSRVVVQSEITEDDIKDICDYVKDVIGNNAVSVIQSNFCKVVAPVIQFISYDNWVEIFSLLWNKNEEMSHLFSVLINEYKKLDFNNEVYIPFDAVLRDKGTILKIEWLDSVCGVNTDTGQDIIYTDIYAKNGHLLAHNFSKGNLSALIAELEFQLPETIAGERQFLKKVDLLDFPGARSREKFKENEDIRTVLPKILRRGKVAYLFNKYSRSLRISSVLFCHHNDQKTEPTIGETINSWIEDNIGGTPKERAEMLENTNGIAPLFMIATKFNMDLERTKIDTASNLSNLDKHWNRFDTVIPEIIKPYKWMDEWVPKGGKCRSSAFQNIYPLRDFYWSGKGNIFVGYSESEHSKETGVYVHKDFPDYMNRLFESFLRNKFVQVHFADPKQTWSDVATINNDGSKAIIRNLDSIASVLDDARRIKYLDELKNIQKEMCQTLSVYYEPEESEEKNRKVTQICGDIRRSLIFSIGRNPEIFGKIIDCLMVPVGEMRNIAYDIIICHTDTPKDFSHINLIRAGAGINTKDNKEVNIKKLCTYFICDEEKLKDVLSKEDCTMEEIVSDITDTPTTVADVVAMHIVDFWVNYLNGQAKELEAILPHAGEVTFMLISLFKKLNVKKEISEKISTYCSLFPLDEQPNAIADYASLTLNNFVSNVGRNYINDGEIPNIQQKAAKCNLTIDTTPDNWNVIRKPQPLLQTLKALDESTHIVNQNVINTDVLRKLPFWDNFQRWQNLVTIGLVYASDISQCDPVANAEVKEIMDNCKELYQEHNG